MKGRKMWLVRCHFFCDHSISVIDFFGRWAIPLPRPFLTLVSFVKCYFRGTVFGPSPCVPLLLVELRQLLEALASQVEDVLTPARFGIRRFECEWSASRLVVLSPSSHFPLLSSVALCRWCSIGWKSIRFADFRWWSHVGDWLRGAKGQWWNLLLMMDITSECADYPAVDKQIARICRQIQSKDANSIQIIINKHVSFNHFDLYCARHWWGIRWQPFCILSLNLGSWLQWPKWKCHFWLLPYHRWMLMSKVWQSVWWVREYYLLPSRSGWVKHDDKSWGGSDVFFNGDNFLNFFSSARNVACS